MIPTFYSSEKRPVILQLSKRFSKVGFGSEHHPRAIIATPELQSEQLMGLGTATLTSSQWDPIIESLVKRIYFHYLQVVPAERKVVLLENDLLPTPIRQSLSRVLFENMKVPSIVYLSEMATPLYTCGVSTGIVIDIGYHESRVLPVCFGAPIREAYQTTRLGSATVNRTLRDMLMKAVDKNTIPKSDKKLILSKVSRILELCYT